jgi:hypothetical protein
MLNARVIDELEWWDRTAPALDILLQRPGLHRAVINAGGRTVDWTGDAPPPAGATPAAPGAAPEATAYLFHHLQDPEGLRRLNQLPDDLPLDLLARPFALYCPDMKSFVCVNAPEVPLEEHLQKLKETSL